MAQTTTEDTVITQTKHVYKKKYTTCGTQTHAFAGIITNVKDSALAGIAINIKGSNKLSLSNDKGVFVVNYVNYNDTLVFTGLGYKTVELPAGNKQRLNLKISLQEEAKQLDDVVVVSYPMRGCRYTVCCGGCVIRSHIDSTWIIKNDSIFRKLAKPVIKIYPNPTATTATITNANNLQEIVVTDFNGRQLQKIIPGKSTTVTIAISTYPAATYLIKYITKDKKQGIEKLVVIH